MYSSLKSAIRYNKEITNSIILANINTNLEGIFTLEEIKIFLIAYTNDQVLFSTSTSFPSMLYDIKKCIVILGY